MNQRASLLSFGLAVLVALTPVVRAQSTTAPADHPAHHPSEAVATQQPSSMSDGEVRKIDRDPGKITLRHGPLVNLDMPAMTMVFKVADTQLLATLKDGDKVRFAADKVNGVLTVTAIEITK